MAAFLGLGGESHRTERPLGRQRGRLARHLALEAAYLDLWEVALHLRPQRAGEPPPEPQRAGRLFDTVMIQTYLNKSMITLI